MNAANSISTITTAIGTPTATPTTKSSSSSVVCTEVYSLSTISGPRFYSYNNIVLYPNIAMRSQCNV